MACRPWHLARATWLKMFEVILNMTIHAGEGSCEGVPLYRLYKAMMKQFAGKNHGWYIVRHVDSGRLWDCDDASTFEEWLSLYYLYNTWEYVILICFEESLSHLQVKASISDCRVSICRPNCNRWPSVVALIKVSGPKIVCVSGQGHEISLDIIPVACICYC